MAYRFGQFRREQLNDYITNVEPPYSFGYQETKVEGTGKIFSDLALIRDFAPSDGSLFLRFSLRRFSRDTGVTIKLIKNTDTSLAQNTTQTVAHILVPAAVLNADLNIPMFFDIVITPEDKYDKIAFIIDRDGKDLTGESIRTYSPNDLSFTVETFGKITNIIEEISSSIDNANTLKQIGIQSRPGLEMCINGEMIRVGRSGIYELNHGIDINFIGFMPGPNDHFLMDYQY